jgi:hypothetical protein
MDPTFLGSVLDLDIMGCSLIMVGRLVRGESGADPFLIKFFLGGATGPLAPDSPLGGNGGRIGPPEAATPVAPVVSPMAFLACVLLLGCLWYMSSQARQNIWSEHEPQRTKAAEVPHKSHASLLLGCIIEGDVIT